MSRIGGMQYDKTKKMRDMANSGREITLYILDENENSQDICVGTLNYTNIKTGRRNGGISKGYLFVGENQDGRRYQRQITRRSVRHIGNGIPTESISVSGNNRGSAIKWQH